MSLVIGGVDLGSFTDSETKPTWLNFAKNISRFTGDTTLLDYTAAYNNLDQFLFYSNSWTIGGIVFDGILKTEHSQEVKATQYPVQTGTIMTDHAITLPATLDIQIMVSDANTQHTIGILKNKSFLNNAVVDYITNTYINNGKIVAGNNRAISAWQQLKAMQLAKMPITVVTKLGTYKNMLIKKISTPDDVKTLTTLIADIRLVEIQTAKVTEVVVSARAQATESNNSGTKAVDTSPSSKNQTALKALSKGGGVF